MFATDAPFNQYFDTDGSPLDGGYVYYGQSNQNPETFPISVFWDAAGTIPAEQPIRTLNGYAVRTGAPAIVYTDTDYSIVVKNYKGVTVYTAPSSAEFNNNLRPPLLDKTDPTKGGGMVGYKRGLAYPAGTLAAKVQDRNDLRDWATDMPYNSDTAAAKLQMAADAFAAAGSFPLAGSVAGKDIEPLWVPADPIKIVDTLMLPPGFRIRGAGRHSDLREFGDTTGGVDHPRRGTLFYTDTTTIQARRWTDIDGADVPIKPAIVLLGEGISLEDFTLYTPPSLGSAIDTGIHIAGTGKHFIKCVDIRGGWKKGGLYFDATWSSTNTTLLGMTHLPDWMPAAALYDFGLTDTLVMKCRIYGIRAVTVQGSTRTSAPDGWVWGPNGISDTILAYCQLYNEGDQPSRASDGALLHLDYKGGLSVNAQGFTLHSCRLDSGAKWVVNVDHHDDLQITGGRTFCETSASWNAYQISQGVAVEAQRGRLNFTENAGTSAGSQTANIEGEIFANLAYNGAGNVRLEDHDYRSEGGKRISYRGPRGESNAWHRTDGEIGVVTPALKSWAGNGRINFMSMESNTPETWGYMDKTQASFSTCADFKWGPVAVTFKRNDVTFLSDNGTNTIMPRVYADTTASAANVQVESDGRVRRSTSAAKYKADPQPLSAEKVAAFMNLAPVSYLSLCPGDPQDKRYVGVIADQAADLGLEELVVRSAEGEIENFAYERSIAFLLAKLQEQEQRLSALEQS